jgi:hypothetical protein
MRNVRQPIRAGFGTTVEHIRALVAKAILSGLVHPIIYAANLWHRGLKFAAIRPPPLLKEASVPQTGCPSLVGKD